MIRCFLAPLLLLLTTTLVHGGVFSVDFASPAIGLVPTTEGDILADGPTVVVPGAALGLIPFDNLNALSYGRDMGDLVFSVDRLTVGVPGSAVATESAAGEAAGDTFGAFFMGSNILVRDESAIPLLPGPGGDDIDALNFVDGTTPYFSIDSLSASNGFGALTMANDIFLGTLGSVFASGEADLGLDPFDDIDGLILVDTGIAGLLEPGIDAAIFSLSAMSPSTFTGGPGIFSPADLLFSDFSGGFGLFASAASIGLLPTDELNALSLIAPPPVNAVPEPGSVAIWACGLGVFAFYRRRKSDARRRLPAS